MAEKTFIMDVDRTIRTAPKNPDGSYDYANARPHLNVIAKANMLYDQGHRIIYYSACGMRTFKGDVYRIEEYHRPILEKWAADHGVKYTELKFGKIWYQDYFFVDDRNLTIDQFLTSETEELEDVLTTNASKQD